LRDNINFFLKEIPPDKSHPDQLFQKLMLIVNFYFILKRQVNQR